MRALPFVAVVALSACVAGCKESGINEMYRRYEAESKLETLRGGVHADMVTVDGVRCVVFYDKVNEERGVAVSCDWQNVSRETRTE